MVLSSGSPHPDPLGSDHVADPLQQLTLEQLRTRTSVKWSTHPDDVLPLWVAEMDVALAPPVARRLQQAIASGDTGYPNDESYARALSSFAADRWGGPSSTSRRPPWCPT